MEANIVVEAITHVGSDRLLITGYLDRGDEYPRVSLRAQGWLSAVTNHYPPEHYGEDGHLIPEATPRHMTDAELLAYAGAQLLATLSFVAAEKASSSAPLYAKEAEPWQ